MHNDEWFRNLLIPLLLLYFFHWTTHLRAQGLASPVDHPVVCIEAADFCEDGEWHLVFEDNFNGDTLDTDRWLRYFPLCEHADECQPSRTGFPDQIQIAKDENVQMTGLGTVKLIDRKGTLTHWYSGASKYSSGMLFSKLRFNRGRFEIRCKVPLSTSDRLWPAFWLYGDGPNCPEIDVMEIVHDRSNMYHQGLHCHTYDCKGSHASEEDTHALVDLSNDFHVFRADRDKWFINFYVDDMLLHRSCRIYDLLNRPVSSCYIPAGIYIQNQAFPAQDAYVALTVGLGIHNSGPNDSVGPGPPVPNIPCAMEIDYIRVYQR